MTRTYALTAGVVLDLIGEPDFVAPFFFGLLPYVVCATLRLPEAGRVAVRA